MKQSVLIAACLTLAATFTGCVKDNGELGYNYLYPNVSPAVGDTGRSIVTYSDVDTILASFSSNDNVEWVSIDTDGDGKFDVTELPPSSIGSGKQGVVTKFDPGVYETSIAVKRAGSTDIEVTKVDVTSLATTRYRKAVIEDVSALWCSPCGATYSYIASTFEPFTGLGSEWGNGLMFVWLTDRSAYGWSSLDDVISMRETYLNQHTCYGGFIPFMTMNSSSDPYDQTVGHYCDFRSYLNPIADPGPDWRSAMAEVNTIQTDMFLALKASRVTVGNASKMDVEVSVTTDQTTAVPLTDRNLYLYAVANKVVNVGPGAYQTPASSYGGRMGPVAIGVTLIPMSGFAVEGKTVSRHFSFDIPSDASKHEWHPELDTATPKIATLGVQGIILNDTAAENWTIVNGAAYVLE